MKAFRTQRKKVFDGRMCATPCCNAEQPATGDAAKCSLEFVQGALLIRSVVLRLLLAHHGTASRYGAHHGTASRYGSVVERGQHQRSARKRQRQRTGTCLKVSHYYLSHRIETPGSLIAKLKTTPRRLDPHTVWLCRGRMHVESCHHVSVFFL